VELHARILPDFWRQPPGGANAPNRLGNTDDRRWLFDGGKGRRETSAARFDTDRGGVPDGREDRNRNGRIDKGETNPRKPGSG